MTSQESVRAAVEARRAVGASTAPVSLQETAMQRYLEASAYHGSPMAAASTADQARPVAAPAVVHRSVTDNPVVVGIDGSGCAWNAARWAADEATRRQTGLRLIHAYHLPPAGSSGYNPYPPHLLTDLREDGAAVLQDTAKSLQRSHPGLKVSTDLAYGDPATVLRHASTSAALVVLGTRGGSRIKVAVGSVAASVAATSASPVAVIHPASKASDGPVVVAVDGSPEGQAAIDYAFQVAAERGSTLLAAHCWTTPTGNDADVAHVRAVQEALIGRELAAGMSKYPQVRVERELIDDRPASGLLALTDTAQLIVAGSHGHRGLTSLVLGSTSQALLAKSRCPVVIARPKPTESPVEPH